MQTTATPAKRWHASPPNIRPDASRTRCATRPSARCSTFWRPASAAASIRPTRSCCGSLPTVGQGTATIVGRKERADELTATFLNSAGANIDDFCDTHLPTVIHPTAPIMPPLYALSELQRVRGADLLDAFALGVEVACRIGNSISPSHYRTRGWHITASCGVFGAAAAAGRMLGLDTKQMVWALGGAAAQSSGLVEMLGQPTKSLGVGNAGAQRIVVGAAGEARLRRSAASAGRPLRFLQRGGRNAEAGRRCSTASARPGSCRSTPTSRIPAAW